MPLPFLHILRDSPRAQIFDMKKRLEDVDHPEQCRDDPGGKNSCVDPVSILVLERSPFCQCHGSDSGVKDLPGDIVSKSFSHLEWHSSETGFLCCHCIPTGNSKA